MPKCKLYRQHTTVNSWSVLLFLFWFLLPSFTNANKCYTAAGGGTGRYESSCETTPSQLDTTGTDFQGNTENSGPSTNPVPQGPQLYGQGMSNEVPGSALPSSVLLQSRLLLNPNAYQVRNDVSNETLEEMEEVSNWSDDVEQWDAPEWLLKQFPYYLSGYDDEHRPIWVAEYGKYDIRKVVEEGEPNVSLLEKYAKQAAYRIKRSIKEQARKYEEVSEAYYILDMDGITISQLTHPPSMVFKLQVVRNYRDIFVNHLAGVVVVNANYVAHSLINLFRPVFGRVMEKVEIYGTQPSKWIPQLRRIFPPDSLPPWYGGNQNHQPVRVYG